MLWCIIDLAAAVSVQRGQIFGIEIWLNENTILEHI
jgi:hypothetical protein